MMMKRNHQVLPSKRRQAGIVLFMSLVMLLLLTMLGVSSIQTTSLQLRMARNANDGNLAFQAAEVALKDGEDLLENLNNLTDFGDPLDDLGGNQANGYYFEAAPGDPPNWKDLGDWTDGGFRISETHITEERDNCDDCQPKYIVEHVQTIIADADALNLDNIGEDIGAGRTEVFRVTARGYGATEDAQVMIQGTYGKQF
jgi:type IV pilus assembly protein PilX|tara:strand:- start:119 stop:715 length:597 start_codon:yes stop_codon:yes gene_type:complete